MTFTYTINLDNELMIVTMRGRLMDKNDTLAMMEEISENLLDGNNQMIIDLAKLEYMNSTGLNVMIGLLTKSRNDGGEAIICNVSKSVDALFVMTKLNTVFTVVPTREDAIAKLTETQQQS
jgi:anti-anti-sigma factor